MPLLVSVVFVVVSPMFPSNALCMLMMNPFPLVVLMFVSFLLFVGLPVNSS